MKNFKKVISSVIALAISASTFTAVSASSFSDVPDTASYAEAVDVLAALGIVTGYEEDGQFTFKPEGNITRAEAATMIVGALNMTEEAKNSSATCQFADVNEHASWAAGYVNVGVSEGFINGRSADEFDPQANVTYAEMCVMTTKLTGYADYATSNIKEGDPWYKCYTDMAASAGLNKGVSVPLTSALTRGHVAQMIYNALVTPKLGIVEYSFVDNKYAPLDGGETGTGEFKTLLSEKFDGYVATVEILGTPKSGTNNGEVLLNVTKADRWADRRNTASSADDIIEPGVELVGIKDIDNQLFQSGTAVLLINDLDEAEMIYFKANAKMETKEVEVDEYVMQGDRRETFADGNGIQFGTSAPVKVTRGAELYVNGARFNDSELVQDVDEEGNPLEDEDGNPIMVEVVDRITNNQLDKFLSNAQGKVTFVKTNRGSNEFDKIFVDYYEVGKVTSVMYKGEKTTVNFTVTDNAPTLGINGVGRTVRIEIDDEEVADGEVEVYAEKNGTEIELKEIAKGDVIAVAVDYSVYFADEGSATITNPGHIEVLATDETVRGMVLDYDDDYGTYTVGEETYKYVGYDEGDRELDVSVTYDLLLDPFGRIINDFEAVATGVKFAIFEKHSDEGKVSLLLADGSVASYELGSGDLNGDELEAMEGTDVLDRVVTYKVSGDTVKLYEVDPANRTNLGKYNATTGKLGSVTITDEVNMVDAEQYMTEENPRITDYAKLDVSELKSQVEYEGAAYRSGDVFSFVVVTQAGTVFTEESRFAVIVKDPASAMNDGDVCVGAKAYYKGEEVTLYWDTTDVDAVDVAEGDVIFFTTNADGYVNNEYVIYSRGGALANTLPDGSYVADDWYFGFDDTTADIKVVSGVVAKSKSNSITFGKPVAGILNGNVYEDKTADGETEDDLEGMFTFGIADDCTAYIWDGAVELGSSSQYKRYEILDDASAIVESDLVEATEINDEGEEEEIDDVYDMTQGSIHRAVALTVNGDVVAIFVMYPTVR